MKRIMLITIILILFIVSPVFANSNYNYTLNHSFDLKLDGEFTFNSTVVTPAQGNVDIAIDGTGSAELKSILEILESSIETGNWFELF